MTFWVTAYLVGVVANYFSPVAWLLIIFWIFDDNES